MKKTILSALTTFTLLNNFSPLSIDAPQPNIELLPDITLTVPENPDHVAYLGLKGKPGEQFTLSDIDADVLMIELFSMYCPYCQKAAPTINELHERMEKTKRPDLKLVIIGIGANNTDLEVETFRDGFDIAFPLFSDPDLSIYQTLTGAGTPTFIGCRINSDGDNFIFYRKSGGFKDPSEFLDNLLDRSGLQ